MDSNPVLLAIEFLGICVGIALVVFIPIFLIGAAIAKWDSILVAFMRRFDIRLYPVAIAIAKSIMEHPDEWSFDKYHMIHPIIGSIWTANEAYGLHVETEVGKWKPNMIERRIIRDAVDWRIGDYIRNRLALTMQKNALLFND